MTSAAAPEPPAPRLWTSEAELRQAIPLGGTRFDQMLWLQNEFKSFNAWEVSRTRTSAIGTTSAVLRAVVTQELAAFKAEMAQEELATKEAEATHTLKKPVITGSGPVQSAVSSTSTGGSVAVPRPFCAPASDRPSTFGPVTESGSQFGRPAYPPAPPPPANNGLPPFWPSVASQFPSSIVDKSSGSATAHLMGDHYQGPYGAHPYGGWPPYHPQFSHSPLAAAASSQVESSSQPSTAPVGQTVATNKSAASAVVASNKEEKAMVEPVTESSTAPVGSFSESMVALDLHGPGHKPEVKLPGTQSGASSVKTGAPASTENQRSDSHNEDVNDWKEQGAGWVQGDGIWQEKRWTTSQVKKLVSDAFQANGRYLPGGYISSGDGGYDPISNITAKPAASVQSGVKTEAVPIAPAQMVTPQATSSTASSAPRPGVPKNQPLTRADRAQKAAGLPDPTPSSNARPRATKGTQKSSASNSGSKRAGRGVTNASARDDARPTRADNNARLFHVQEQKPREEIKKSPLEIRRRE